MGEFPPPYASLDGTSPAVLYALPARHAELAMAATYEFGWQRDQALIEAIDPALTARARGDRAGSGASRGG